MKKTGSYHQLLIVSATSLEIKPLLEILGKGDELGTHVKRYTYKRFQVDVLITGVGMVPTAVLLSMQLSKTSYDAVINAGICGSFKTEIPLGTVLNIITDCLPETGAEDGEQFLSLIDLNLLDKDEFPFSEGKLINDSVFESSLVKSLHTVNGITVNTVHGNQKTISMFLKRNNPDIESMEGAAFFYACKLFKTKFLQIRSVSNYVQERNVSKWELKLAIQNLNSFLLDLLNE